MDKHTPRATSSLMAAQLLLLALHNQHDVVDDFLDLIEAYTLPAAPALVEAIDDLRPAVHRQLFAQLLGGAA